MGAALASVRVGCFVLCFLVVVSSLDGDGHAFALRVFAAECELTHQNGGRTLA